MVGAMKNLALGGAALVASIALTSVFLATLALVLWIAIDMDSTGRSTD